MIQTLLVDDEYLIRELLKGSIQFQELGFAIVGEAEDGLQALQKVQELSPELIILDINIPFINGVELARIVKANNPEINIIVLTGFEEFAYARDFIRIGVFDYVLKPIEPAKFQETLLEFRRKIETERKGKTHLETLEKEAESGSALLRRQTLIDLLDGKLGADADIEGWFQALDIDLSPQRLCLATIEVDRPDRTRSFDGTNEQPFSAVVARSTAHFSQLAASVTVFEKERRVVCIVNSAMANGSDIVEICTTIQADVVNTCGCSVSIGIGGPGDGYTAIPDLYKDSIAALEEKFFQGSNSVIVYQATKTTLRAKEARLIREKHDFLILLRAENQQHLVDFLDALRHEIIQAHPPVDMAYAIYLDLWAEIMEYIWENNLNIEEIIPNAESMVRSIRLNETIGGLHQWIVDVTSTVVVKVRSKSRSRSMQIVDKARKLIDSNYWRADLSIVEVSEQIFVNPSYLSKVFKRDMGYSMVEYLMDLRMSKAKQLMDASDAVNVSEVAHRVGYTDPFYFSKLFKKAFGVAPSKYLERKHRR